MAPSTAWLLRNRRGMLPAGISLWGASLIGIFGSVHWFNRQPYSVSEGDVVGSPIHPTMYLHLMVLLLQGLLCLLLLVLPVLAAWLPELRRLSRKVHAPIAACLLAATAFYILVLLEFPGRLGEFIAPWISHVLVQLGMSPAPDSIMLGSAPANLPVWVRIAISLTVIAAGLAFVAEQFARKSPAETRSPEQKSLSWREMSWLLGPFALCYVALLLPRSIHGFLFDRYLLLLMPVVIIVLLRLHERRLRHRTPSAQMACTCHIRALRGRRDP